MEKLFLKQKKIPMQSLLDMKTANSAVKKAKVSISGYNPNMRSTDLRVDIEARDYPDVNYELLQMVNVWDGTLDPNNFFVKEYNYLVYNKGDHFKRHVDHLTKNGAVDPAGRLYSTSTVISKSEDLKGGDLVIHSKDGYSVIVNLEVGETVFFDSFTNHEVTKVIQGTREVLVAWIHKK